MSLRLTTRHRALIVTFAAVWLACIGLRVIGFDRPAFRAAYVSAEHGEYPVVQGFLSPASESLSTLHTGDRLIRLGDRDLRGQGQLDFETTEADVAWRVGGPFRFDVARGGQRFQLVEPAPERHVAEFIKDLAISTAFALTAILISVRARSTPGSRALFYGLAVYSLEFALLILDGPRLLYAAELALSIAVSVAMPPLLTMSFLGFPDEAALLRGWNRAWPWALSLLGVAIFSSFHGFPITPAAAKPLASIGVVAWIAALVGSMTLNYRRCGPVGRRQIKWILYSVYVGAVFGVIVFVGNGVVVADSPAWAHAMLVLSALTLPIGLSIAALRFDLFDIDRLVGTMVAYNLLAVVAVGAAFLLVPLVTASFTGVLGVDATMGRTVVAAGLATLAIYSQRQVRPQIDRWFFKERFALERAMAELPERYAAVRRPDELWAVTGEALVSNLRPASCVIFTTAGDSFVPFFTSGNTNAQDMPATHPLAAWIETLNAASLTDRRGVQNAGADATAMLSELGAALVLPIRRAGALEAFVCLGVKRSGDIYTPTDLSLLTALAKSLSTHMLRFDEAELLERAQAMSAKMRRYVPGVVADAIARGDSLETGERDVSVLFVDIRGYTAMTDGRRAEDVFSIINRYTETVSAIVKDCGGVIVEFNGDGMMAVFGAPVPIEQKERSAVLAAKRLADGVPRVESASVGATPVTVGIGVATGPAFVGNIEAADRTIWSAIGSTTNFAARLQTMTRDLNAVVLIDSTTYARAGDAGRGFREQSNVAVRGRARTETVWSFSNGSG